MSTRRSLRPRSATTRCLTLPSSRKASTTRTYSLTVPLEERTFTVLGYMRPIITTNQGESREICGNSRKTLNQIVTTLFGPTRGPLREEPGNQGVFAHGSCRPGWLHPKHGIAVRAI